MAHPIDPFIASFLKYVEVEKRYSKHTIIAYSNDLEQFLSFLERDYPETQLNQLKPGIIRTWLAENASKGLEHRSLARKIATLKSMVKYLRKQGDLTSDPMLGVSAPKFQKKVPEQVRPSDISKLFSGELFTQDFSGIRDFLVLEFLYGTGVRLSELIETSWKDIDLLKGQAKVHGKGNKQRLIPLNENLVEVLKLYAQECEQSGFENSAGFLILTDKGRKAYPMFIQRLVKRYLSMITTAEQLSPHLLRHSFATHLLNKGADLNAIKDLMGHQSLAATQVYTHSSIEELKKIFDQAHPKA